MKSIIHVAQQAIQQNRKDGGNRPPLIVRNYKGAKRAHTLIIYDKDGREAARIVHSPHKPLSCGARVWIETEGKVEATLDQEPASCPLESFTEASAIVEKTVTPTTIKDRFERDFPNPVMRNAIIRTNKRKETGG